MSHKPFARLAFWPRSRFAARPEAWPMRIALFEPDIPQNTGTILRLAACLGLEAHIIEPAGFATSDRAFRRAGMDYLDQVELVRHPSWEAFEAWRGGAGARLILFTTRAHHSYLAAAFRRGTSCCSDAKRRACRRKCMRPPTRGSSFRCGKDCARSMWRWPPLWRWVKRCGKPRRPSTAGADASRQTPAKNLQRCVRKREHPGFGSRGKSDYSSELESSRKNTKRVRDISRPWALPLTRIARWRSVASCRLPKSPHKRRRTLRTPNIPHARSVPRNHGKKKLRLEFSPAQTMAKKSLAEISLFPKTPRVCRAHDSRVVLDLKAPCKLAAHCRPSNPPHRRDGIACPMVTACLPWPKPRTEVR